jgi:hypothetical protein
MRSPLQMMGQGSDVAVFKWLQLGIASVSLSATHCIPLQHPYISLSLSFALSNMSSACEMEEDGQLLQAKKHSLL